VANAWFLNGRGIPLSLKSSATVTELTDTAIAIFMLLCLSSYGDGLSEIFNVLYHRLPLEVVIRRA